MGGLTPHDGAPPGVLLTPLAQVAHPKGAIFHALKAGDDAFHGFGEAYFTQIVHAEVKGWKRHSRMVLNLVVPQGAVRFYVVDEARGTRWSTVLGGAPEQYARLTVPPGVWVAFRGLAPGSSLILNVASIAHDPAEASNCALDTWPLEDA